MKNRHKQFVIDGEAVVVDAGGVADFNALHSRSHDEAVQPGSPLWAISDMTAYSITASARVRSVGGTVRPSALAVFRLITSSNFVGS